MVDYRGAVNDSGPESPTSPLVAAGIDDGGQPIPSAEKFLSGQASQSKLIWWRFRRHRLAMAGAIVALLVYGVAILGGFLAPHSPWETSTDHQLAPPQLPRLLQSTDAGTEFHLHVREYEVEMDTERLARTYAFSDTETISLGFFVRGATTHKFLGLFESNLRFFGPIDPNQRFHLFGADRNGRDVLSRVVYATRISMTIGLIGVTLSLGLGILFGGISGYFGGGIDNFIQRLIEFSTSIPTIPLWMGLAAAIPPAWGPLQRYLAITIILSMVGWTTLARVVRGRFLSLREEDFIVAARLDCASTGRVIFRHMLPSFTSHIIAATTLAIPSMILAETALSFIGLGLQPPVLSWGVLLQEAQNIRSIAAAPWLLIWPSVAVVIAVLALNFFGDGLRDASDPYGGV